MLPGAERQNHSATATGSCIIGNVETHLNKTIAQVRGAAPIITSGSTVTNSKPTEVFDSANHSDTQGAYFLRVNVQDTATAILGSFLGTNGANLQLSDGTNTATRPFTVDTDHKVGIVYDSVANLMAINVDGTWSSDVTYDGTLLSGALDFARTVTGVVNGREIKRFDTDITDGKTKIDELMA